MTTKILRWILVFVPVSICVQGWAQDPTRFSDIMSKYRDMPLEVSERPIIFTGSSSILMWNDLQDRFAGYPVINRGFGGSQMSDLLHYLDDLIIRWKPKQVFIYEGDNDLAYKKSVQEILGDTKKLVARLVESIPDVKIVLIAAKPSVNRWHLSDKYLSLNRAFSRYAQNQDFLTFADIWYPALAPSGKVQTDIFKEDGLHMNAKGYDIWQKILTPMIMNH